MVSHNGYNYDYRFIQKEFPIEKEVTRIDINGKKSQEPYLRVYYLLITQGLWEAHYQILLIALLMEFIK